jgi:hypothetical protein
MSVEILEQQSIGDFGPSGSIFLPEVDYTERDLYAIEFAILARRGIAEGVSLERQAELLDQLAEQRRRNLGREALTHS